MTDWRQMLALTRTNQEMARPELSKQERLPVMQHRRESCLPRIAEGLTCIF